MCPSAPGIPWSVTDIAAFVRCGFNCKSFQKYEMMDVGCIYSKKVLMMSAKIPKYLEFLVGLTSLQRSVLKW